LLEGKTVVDLGCGVKKIVPWAVGVDDGSAYGALKPASIDRSASVDPEKKTLPVALDHATFQVVFSSHALEHIRAPILETLRYWMHFVSVGGLLILYLPSEARYVFDHTNRKLRNPQHHHYLTPETFVWYLEQLDCMTIEALEEDPQIHDHYSFLAICRRHR
jgi:hypothetical protein